MLEEKTGHAWGECGSTQVDTGQITGIGADGPADFPGAVYSLHGDQHIEVLVAKTFGGSVRRVTAVHGRRAS